MTTFLWWQDIAFVLWNMITLLKNKLKAVNVLFFPIEPPQNTPNVQAGVIFLIWGYGTLFSCLCDFLKDKVSSEQGVEKYFFNKYKKTKNWINSLAALHKRLN